MGRVPPRRKQPTSLTNWPSGRTRTLASMVPLAMHCLVTRTKTMIPQLRTTTTRCSPVSSAMLLLLISTLSRHGTRTARVMSQGFLALPRRFLRRRRCRPPRHSGHRLGRTTNPLVHRCQDCQMCNHGTSRRRLRWSTCSRATMGMIRAALARPRLDLRRHHHRQCSPAPLAETAVSFPTSYRQLWRSPVGTQIRHFQRRLAHPARASTRRKLRLSSPSPQLPAA